MSLKSIEDLADKLAEEYPPEKREAFKKQYLENMLDANSAVKQTTEEFCKDMTQFLITSSSPTSVAKLLDLVAKQAVCINDVVSTILTETNKVSNNSYIIRGELIKAIKTVVDTYQEYMIKLDNYSQKDKLS